jgi:hypothetical protein
MNWQTPEKKKDRSVTLPENWLVLHYYEALTVLFRIENSLRTFVYVVLKDKKKGEWHSGHRTFCFRDVPYCLRFHY